LHFNIDKQLTRFVCIANSEYGPQHWAVRPRKCPTWR